ncbi:response regulator [Streptomyces canus]|uniref:response regulator n=1 Tax=Streptomyces canus TaxID=58343 RepID=UPI003712E186
MARIHAVLRRSRPPDVPTVIRAGSLLVDTAARQASVDGVVLTLRPKEFALLEMLAAAPGRMDLHHGRVGAHSDGPGKGATFTVVLPTAGSTAPPRSRSTAARTAPRRLAVLIVEDNEDLAATYHTLLERQGHRVTSVHTGTAALTATGTEAFDVVLCDLGLPDIDGHTVARRMRARPDGERLRLIAVSGFSRGTDRALSREAGFDAQLNKPLPLTELTEILERPDGD